MFGSSKASPAPGGTFSFGGTTPAAGGTPAFGTTSAPASTFGAPPATFGTAPAPTSTTTGGFGAPPAPAATTAPGAGGFGFGTGTPGTAPPPVTTPQQQQPPAKTVPLPDFDKDLSPGAADMRRLMESLSTIHQFRKGRGDDALARTMAEQELSSLLKEQTKDDSCLLLPSKKATAAFCVSAQEASARLGKVQQEYQQSASTLYEITSSLEQKPLQAQLTPDMQRTVANIATTLCLPSWISAVSLFQAAVASTATATQQEQQIASRQDRNSSGPQQVERRAYQLYLSERGLYGQTLLLLVQYRWCWKQMQETAPSQEQEVDWTQALDNLLQAKNGVLVANLLTRMQESIQTAMDLSAAAAEARRSGTAPYTTPSQQQQTEPNDKNGTSPAATRRMKCHFLMQQAHMAAMTLFFLAYQQQQQQEQNGSSVDFLGEQHIVEIINAIQALTNQYCSVEVLDHLATADNQTHSGSSVGGAYGSQNTLGFGLEAGGIFSIPSFAQQQQQQTSQNSRLPYIQRREETDAVLLSARVLRCVGMLIMTVQCTLESFRQRSNSIGSPTTATPLLQQYFAPTEKESLQEKWKRRDILGLLMSFYATSCVHETARTQEEMAAVAEGGGISPRHQQRRRSSITVDNVHRKTWCECIDAALEYKSFSFARTSLVPALRMPAQNYMMPSEGVATALSSCSSSLIATVSTDVSDFFLSAMAGFASQYLEMITTSTSERPISRAKWLQDAEAGLQLRRAHQEQQRQFQQWSGTANGEQEETLPDAVDLLLRPDCMDDVVAFCVAVCSLGPEYSMRFWSRREQELEPVTAEQDLASGHSPTMRLVASKALKELAREQDEDASLNPCFVSFLAALAVAGDGNGSTLENGAAVIHEMLSTDQKKEAGLSRMRTTNWPSLIEVLRYYVQQLSTDSFSSTSPTEGLGTASSRGSSTAYYYHAEQTGSTEEASSGTTGWSSWSRDGTRTESVSTRSKPRELGEENTYILLSHLTLIQQVASRSATARLEILSVNIPMQSTDGSEVIGRNSTLNILFALAGMPVSPEVRGAVFETIASLFSTAGASLDQKGKLREKAIEGWELLELCQIFPVYLFEQYPSVVVPGNLSNMPRIHFPPASMALVKRKPGKTWIPAETSYSVVYEMEYVEAAMGIYPSTCGFLSLLRALFTVGGSPSGLGQTWRVRTGCTPYIEYVTHVVLPRITGGFANLPALPFRSLEDKSRLSALSLAVVESVLATYILPTKGIKPSYTVTDKDASGFIAATRTAARKKLVHQTLADLVTVEPSLEDAKQSVEDFRSAPQGRGTRENGVVNSAAGSLSSTTDQLSHPASSTNAAVTVPPPKSPGLTVLAEILSSAGGDLLSVISAILTNDQVVQENGMQADQVSLVAALFGTSPTLASNLIVTSESALRPALDSLSYHGAVLATQQATLRALHVLCAATAREDLLYRAIDDMDGLMSVTPVLRFLRKSPAPRPYNVQPRSMKELLRTSDVKSGVLASITARVGNFASDECRDEDIAAASVVLLFEAGNSTDDFGLCRGDALGEARLASMFAFRLLASGERCDSTSAAQLLRLILDRLLTDLRANVYSTSSFARIVLGLPSGISVGLWKRSGPLRDQARDCFDSILLLLKDPRFIFSSRSSEFAADCFEVIYRLCSFTSGDPTTMQRVAYAAERLRSVEFWKAQLLSMLSNLSQPDSTLSRSLSGHLMDSGNVLHCVAWVLKGTANELRLLLGLDGAVVSGLTPQPYQLQGLLSVLYAAPYELLAKLIRPLSTNRIRLAVSNIPEEALRKAKYQLPGAPEVVRDYKALNSAELVKAMKTLSVSGNEQALQTFASQWNCFVIRSCSLAHLSSAIHYTLGSSLVHVPQISLGFVANVVDGHKLLALILEKFTSESSADEDVNVSRNLALSVLVLTEHILAVGASGVVVDGPTICSLLSRAIANLGSGSPSSSEYGAKIELTSILVTALASMLQNVRSEDIREGAHSDLRRAVVVLLQLSTLTDTKSGTSVPSNYALAARACLSKVLSLIGGEHAEHRSDSLVVSIFSKPTGDALLKLVGLLDPDIAKLLKTVAQLPFGAVTLLDVSIMQELRNAADKYRFEASQIEEAQQRSFDRLKVGLTAPPSFLLGHIELMGALLASLTPGHRRHDVAIQIVDILARYDFVVRHLVDCFPTDGDVLNALFECLAQVQIVLSSDQTANRTGYARELVALTMHMAENPLPRNLLPVLPTRLDDSSYPQKSWWDDLSVSGPADSMKWTGSAPKKLSDQVVEYALLGSSMIKCGLSLMRDLPSTSLSSDSALARALCRCVDALQVVDTNMDEPVGSSWPTGLRSSTSIANCATLRQKLEDCTIELLRIILSETKAVNKRQGMGPPTDAEFVQSIQCALTYCALDSSSNLSLSGLRISGDENRPGTIQDLAQALRKELGGNRDGWQAR